MPAIVPSARRDVMPEMNTRRPRASIMVAWEKWLDGWRIFAEVTCCLGMRCSLMRDGCQRLLVAVDCGSRRCRGSACNDELRFAVTLPADWRTVPRLALAL